MMKILSAMTILVAFGTICTAEGNSDTLNIKPARVTGVSLEEVGGHFAYNEPHFIIETSEQVGNEANGKAAAFQRSMYYGACRTNDKNETVLVVSYEKSSRIVDTVPELRQFKYADLNQCQFAISNFVLQSRALEAQASKIYDNRGSYLVALFFNELPEGLAPAATLSTKGLCIGFGQSGCN